MNLDVITTASSSDLVLGRLHRASLPADRPFTTAMARAEGVGPKLLRALVDDGVLRRMLKGVYVATSLGDSTALRCAALALVVPEDCVVCDRHAGWLLGAEMALAPNEHISLRPISVFRPAGMGRLRNGLTDSGERNLTRSDVVEVHGMQVTSPLRTAWDLGRVRWTEPAISGMDALASLRLFEVEELVAGVERFRGMRWVSTLRAIAPLVDAGSQSPGESVLRLAWIEAAIGRPCTQVSVYRNGLLIAVLDLADEELRYAAEFDGAEWHSSPDQRRHDAERRAEVSEEEYLIDVFVGAQLFGNLTSASARIRTSATECRRRRGLRVTPFRWE